MEILIALLIQFGFLTGDAAEYTELPDNVRYEQNKLFIDTEADGIVTIDTDEWI